MVPASEDHAKLHSWLIRLSHKWIHSRQPPRFTFTVVPCPFCYGANGHGDDGEELSRYFFLEKLVVRRGWPFSLAFSFTFWNFEEVGRPPLPFQFCDCDACVSLTATHCLLQQGDACVRLVFEPFIFFGCRRLLEGVSGVNEGASCAYGDFCWVGVHGVNP